MSITSYDNDKLIRKKSAYFANELPRTNTTGQFISLQNYNYTDLYYLTLRIFSQMQKDVFPELHLFLLINQKLLIAIITTI